MRDTFLSFSPPAIGEDEIQEVVAALRSDWLTTGPRVALFQEQFAEFVGAPRALALSSATAAMHVALAVMGIGPGHRVITTAMTFTSTIHVIEQVGAQPVLVDVEADTLNIDPAKVESAIKSGNGAVRAIMPVHLYGHPAEMDPILDLARRHHLAVIEDAAHALPARYRGRLVGAPAAVEGVVNLTAFSFYATKNLTTGEGGMLTGPAEIIEAARPWSLHGMSGDAHARYGSEGSWRYDVVLPGFKYNMTDMQAALGLQQLRRLPSLQARRLEIVTRYNSAFGELDEVEVPAVRAHVEPAWQLYVLRLKLDRLSIDRARFIEELRARNIGASVHFIPVHMHSYYRDKYGYRPEDFPIAHAEFQRIVSLPLSPRLSDRDVDDVIEAVSEIVDRFRA
jgi:dTDP-4-amino-4,6-dideoxygalactose transaminase